MATRKVCWNPLGSASLSQQSAFYKRLIVSNYLPLLSTIFEKDNYKQEKNILKLTSNKYKQNKKYLESFSRFALEHKIQKLNVVRQLILAKNIYLHSFPKKNLEVLCSLNDRLVDSSCSEKIALSLGGHLIIHPTAGHDLPLDEPEWLIEQLLKNHLKEENVY